MSNPTNSAFLNAGIRLIGEPSKDFWTFRWSDFSDGIKIGLGASSQVTDFVANTTKSAEGIPVLGQFLAPFGATAKQLSIGIKSVTSVADQIGNKIDDAPEASGAVPAEPMMEPVSAQMPSFKGKPIGPRTAIM